MYQWRRSGSAQMALFKSWYASIKLSNLTIPFSYISLKIKFCNFDLVYKFLRGSEKKISNLVEAFHVQADITNL